MYLRTAIIAEKRLIGNRVKTSFSNDKIKELWQNFMPRREKILNSSSADLISATEDTFRHIFRTWIPNSAYDLDNKRPHFEVLGENIKIMI